MLQCCVKLNWWCLVQDPCTCVWDRHEENMESLNWEDERWRSTKPVSTRMQSTAAGWIYGTTSGEGCRGVWVKGLKGWIQSELLGLVAAEQGTLAKLWPGWRATEVVKDWGRGLSTGFGLCVAACAGICLCWYPSVLHSIGQEGRGGMPRLLCGCGWQLHVWC